MSKLLGGIQFFLMDYGLSPENQFPTALRQCWKTYLWLIDEKVPSQCVACVCVCVCVVTYRWRSLHGFLSWVVQSWAAARG